MQDRALYVQALLKHLAVKTVAESRDYIVQVTHHNYKVCYFSAHWAIVSADDLMCLFTAHGSTHFE